MTERPPPQLSPSRLNDFLGCAHREVLRLSGVVPDAPDETLGLLSAKGLVHEAETFARLEREVGGAVRIGKDEPRHVKITRTREAMAARAPLIEQAEFAGAVWRGAPDFLLLRETPDGATYEPHDAKLATRLKPSHVVQLSIYADLVAEAGWPRPTMGRILLGGRRPGRDDPSAGAVRLDDFAHVVGRLKSRYERFVSGVRAGAPPPTRALPCAACGQCGYARRCAEEWAAADAVHLLPGLTSSQREKLETKDVSTVAALAATSLTARDFRIGEEAYARLKRQAELQMRRRETGVHHVELRRPERGRGFARLPPPAPGDLFYDIEGDPLHEGGALEYLHGIWGPLNGGEARYVHWWAHDRAEEKRAFEALVDALSAHFDRHPDAHLFHYAPYERTALRRLAMLHATREAEIDRMLRENRLVDLYAVVRQGLVASTESYSIKKIEALYGVARTDAAVAAGGDSIVAYERWREGGDDAILEELRAYNETDVISTAALRDWLEGLRPAGCAYDLRTEKDDKAEERAANRADAEAALDALAEAVRAADGLSPSARETLAELLRFHARADKPAWWAFFERMEADDEALTADLDAVAGLTPSGPAERVKRSWVRTFACPPQETKLRVGRDVVIAATGRGAGKIEAIEPQNGWVRLKAGDANAENWTDRFSIGDTQPLKNRNLREGVQSTCAIAASGMTRAIQAFLDYLERRPPRLRDRVAGEPIVAEGADLVAETTRAMLDMDGTCLFIQGPPGAGKTHTVSRAIAALLKAGKRVAISSNSHKAINHLVGKVEEAAVEAGVTFEGVKKASAQDPSSEHTGPFVHSVTSDKDVGEPDLLAATAYHLCLHDDPAFDHLIIDEAGQVSLGNLAAMARCAKNIVLVGDQMQLPQPTQGDHPGETGLSLLDYLLEGRATVAPDFGILLNVSWRMHPAICSIISDAIYDGRLSAHPKTERRVLRLSADADPALAPAGLRFVPVEHVGATQESAEEADRVAALVESLLGQRWIDDDGRARPLTLDDVLVVAPYNLQVQRLIRALPEGARVGTVDKFQGQEAPVAIVSMATSSPDDAPRGAGFLLNRQRLNVALSRAQSLALLVASPALADWPAKTVEHLKLVDLLVRAMEEGSRAQVSAEATRPLLS
jgi:uncharacterized protein